LDKPQNVVGYDNESDSLVVQPSKQSKVKAIQNIEAWTDGFINYITNFLHYSYQQELMVPVVNIQEPVVKALELAAQVLALV
jgi:hypothetical protein